MKKRILVCGGRKYNDAQKLKEVMTSLLPWFSPTFCIIEGEAPGADTLAKQWAKGEGYPVIGIAANWDRYGNSAGSIRNRWMLEYGLPDLVVAFPGGPGTANMVKRARAANIDVFEVK